MEHCIVKGFLIVLLIQHCTSEGQSTSVQSSTMVNHQDGETKPQEAALPPAEVVPVVSPPSLEEVQQAVLEASEQVESRGAEEVLKDLLERVVEAALGQVEAGGEGAVVVEQNEAKQVEFSESDNEGELLQQTLVHGIGDIEEEATDVEQHEVEEKDALENIGKEGPGDIEEGDTSESVDKITPGVESTGQDVDPNESQAPLFRQGVEVATPEEGKGGLAVKETEEDNTDQEKVMTGAEILVKVKGKQSEQEMIKEPQLFPEQEDVEQIRQDWGREITAAEKTHVDEVEDELIALPLDISFSEGRPVTAEAAVEQEEVKDELVLEERTVDTEEKGPNTSATIGDLTNVERRESVAMVNVEGDQIAEVEDPALETSYGIEKENQVLVIPVTDSEDQTPLEQGSENQSTETLGEVETGEHPHDETKPVQGNEIITPTGNPSLHCLDDAKSAMGGSVDDALAELHQAEGQKPGEVNELVEDTRTTSEAKELGLEAWKIGAFSAAIFLVLETVFIIIYILNCRNKNSPATTQQPCEDGCVEPEAATGADCCDDTLPAGNGDTQQIRLLDTSDVAQTKEKKVEHATIAMADLPPSPTEGLATTGPEQDSSQHMRTSNV